MAGDEQERFEDYLELERYIEDLQAGRAAYPPKDLTPSQANIYRMASFFRSASPEAAEPRPEFVEELHARLLYLQQDDHEDTIPRLPRIQPESEISQENQPQEIPPSPQRRQKGVLRKGAIVSRRSLLSGGAVAAASLAVGTGIGTVINQTKTQDHSGTPPHSPPYAYTGTPLIQDGVPTTLHFVTTLAELGDKAVRFVTDTIVGYVIRNDDDDDKTAGDEGKIIALSATCTHMGCIVQWQETDRHYHCFCHGGLFTEYGQPTNSKGHLRYLSALPRLETVVKDGKVYVKVPTSKP